MTINLRTLRLSRDQRRHITKAGASMLAAAALAVTVAGCKHGEEPSGHVAGWTLVDPSHRHPIIVHQKPTTLAVRVARGAEGLNPNQRAQVVGFLERYRGVGMANSRLVIAVPSGAPNEIAAMSAVTDIRHLARDLGFDESVIAVEAYHMEGDHAPPVKVSYTHFVAEAPHCGQWPTNLAEDPRNVPYPNFGCATQRNLAVMIANPADLLGPRGMTPRSAERNDQVWERFVKGESTITKKDNDEKNVVKGAN